MFTVDILTHDSIMIVMLLLFLYLFSVNGEITFLSQPQNLTVAMEMMHSFPAPTVVHLHSQNGELRILLYEIQFSQLYTILKKRILNNPYKQV